MLGLANQLLDAFTCTTKVTKSHIPIVNTLTCIDVLLGQLENIMESESKTHLENGRPIGSKNTIKKKTQKTTYEKFVTLIELTNMKMLTKMNDET